MKVSVSLLLVISCGVQMIGQTLPLKSLDQLINKEEPAWKTVKEWIATAKNPVEVLPRDPRRSDSALYLSQVTTRSPMGAIIYETGGVLIDHGWIRVLGSGSARLNRSIMDWNRGKSFSSDGEHPQFLLVADDVLGGFFAINGGGISAENIGKVFYLSPDQLVWEATGLGYTEFLLFCFQGDLNKFYKKLRWKTWKSDVVGLKGDEGFLFYPFLWSKEGGDITKDKRSVVPVQELWNAVVRAQALVRH